jgi:hypothetical protein
MGKTAVAACEGRIKEKINSRLVQKRMDKEQLINQLEESREKLLDLVEQLEDEELLEPQAVGTWSVKDLLVHLTLWEAQIITLLWQAKRGQRPTTVHFSNESDDQINARWYTENIDRPLDFVLSDFYSVRDQTIRRVEEFSNQDLTDPNRYPWQNGRPLWDWIAGSSFEHESEHIDDLQAFCSEKRGTAL